MAERREKSFFGPLMLTGGVLVLLGLAFFFVPVMKCVWCMGTGNNPWRDFECFRCGGRGRVTIADYQNWRLQ